MKEPDFIIPIDKEITNFLFHLHTHPRTILSAKFGDGKSYFLDKFQKDENVSKDFKLIKVYPVNYQVAGNVDVFNLLKYDILLQLLVDKMVSEEALHEPFLTNEDGAYFLTTLVEGISDGDPSPKANISKASMKILSAIAHLKSKFTINKGGESSALELIRLFEKNSYQYGDDSLTRLIRQSLNDWRNRTGKQVVLVVEDLDRLDPLHIFRILNVFSSQMDYIYRNGEAPADNLVGSRFGFDSIVFVMEYENLKRLYEHLYGSEASFKGYISKFIPRGYFEYSLRKSANSYFYETISRITGMDQVHISALLSSKMNELSIRDMYYAIKDVDLQVNFTPVKDLNHGFLYMLVVMRLIGIGTLHIISECESLYKKETIPFIRYIIDFTLLDGFSDEKGFLKVDDYSMYRIVGRNEDGFANLERYMSTSNSMRVFNVHTYISKLLDFILL